MIDMALIQETIHTVMQNDKDVAIGSKLTGHGHLQFKCATCIDDSWVYRPMFQNFLEITLNNSKQSLPLKRCCLCFKAMLLPQGQRVLQYSHRAVN